MHPFFYVYTHRASITNSTKYIKVGGVITSTPGWSKGGGINNDRGYRLILIEV